MGMTSCEDWLDVNVDQDSPSNESAAVENRLPWIQRWTNYAYGGMNFRTACSAGVYYTTNGNANTAAVTNNMATGLCTTFYQCWFNGVGANLKDLYEAAKAEGAYHYMAMSNYFHAMGFMTMADIYGEMPYTEALGSSPVPAYDNGKTIYEGCIAKLDEAIELLGKTQETGAPSLAEGDIWNGGDVQKWIKSCYGLKARYLLRISKKSEFDAKAILDCLAKGPQSNADNTVCVCYNSPTDVTDSFLYYGDPIMANGNWCYAGYGNNQRVSKYQYDLLVNMRGAGVEDPRFTKIVPAAMSNIKLDGNGKVLSYEWMRSQPVDMYGEAERLVAGGATSIANPSYATKDVTLKYNIADAAERADFATRIGAIHKTVIDGDTVKVTYQQGSVYINSTNYILAGDTIYVNLRANSCDSGNDSETDVYNYFLSHIGQSAGAVGGTGSYQIRPQSDQEYVTYAEMCFIKAEVLFRQGDKGGALTAYKDGIKAHMDMMQAKLTEWKGSGYDNPDMWPMDEAAISAYLSSAAVAQTSAELTMSDIMLQKWLAMGCSLENWVDMRRFNYSAGNIADFGVVYPGFERSPLFAGQSKLIGTSKTDPQYWTRRWSLPTSLELNYNRTQALAMNANAAELFVWSLPVWWDCATDDEYFNYLK